MPLLRQARAAGILRERLWRCPNPRPIHQAVLRQNTQSSPDDRIANPVSSNGTKRIAAGQYRSVWQLGLLVLTGRKKCHFGLRRNYPIGHYTVVSFACSKAPDFGEFLYRFARRQGNRLMPEARSG